jgi:ubiquinone/menaquinone biosynthesis C-methylase UbiE
MKMTRLEKRFVNRKQKAEHNIEKVRQRLQPLDTQTIRDALELGCGIGAVSAFLADTYAMNVCGTDFDPEQIEIARRMQPESDHLHFSVEDAAHLTFEAASFDLVLSQNVFHHVPDWEAAVREVARVLRPGGYFIWLDLAAPRLIRNVLQPLMKNHGLYTIDEVKAALAKSGLERRFYEQAAHGPLVHHHMVWQKG